MRKTTLVRESEVLFTPSVDVCVVEKCERADFFAGLYWYIARR